MSRHSRRKASASGRSGTSPGCPGGTGAVVLSASGSGTIPGRGSGRAADLVPARISPESLDLLAQQIALFGQRLEDIASQGPPHRGHDDRKEMWVLLSALTVVVIFCFVAFYLNQVEIRDLQGGLQAEISQAGQSTVSSLERRIAGLRLEKVPESQAALERLIREKDQRDAQRFSEFLGDLQRRSQEGDGALKGNLQTIEEQILALRKAIEELQARSVALENQGIKTGWAARTPDGASDQALPDPAGRPLSHGSSIQVRGNEERDARGPPGSLAENVDPMKRNPIP